MDKQQLKDILKRYTKSLIGASGETIITNYGRMRDLTLSLDEKELGDELCTLCDFYTIHQALKAIERENVSLKNCSTDWNSKTVAKGYQLAKECEQAFKEEGYGKVWEEKKKLLSRMANSEPSIGTQLCLMGLYFSGKSFGDYDVPRLKELLSDEPLPKN